MPKPKKRPRKAREGLVGRPAAKAIAIGMAHGGGAVSLPLKTLVLHGLIGGSTGTGKTRVIQVMAEKLVEGGIPVLLADLKGDISGFIKENDSGAAAKRAGDMGLTYVPKSFPMASYSISERFIPLRLRLDAIDATLLARILHLNTTQESNLKIAFIHAKKRDLPIRDLVDLGEVLAHLSKNPDAEAGASPQSIDVIRRQASIAMGEGLNELFGEPDLQAGDLIMPRVNAINLGDWRKGIELPSILMAFILFRLFHDLPEAGPLEKPKLVLFIDEARYLFQNANPSLVSLFTNILRQIRSKGVGVFLSTQNPEDIPEKVLEQLGCKIEFALRAFTAQEMEDVSGIARSFPPTKKYDLTKEILALRIGEAIVSPLGSDGRPLEPVKTQIEPPRSDMGISDDDEIRKALDKALLARYTLKVEPERYDLSVPFEGFKIRRRDEWGAARAEARKYEMKQARAVSRSWSRWKMLGLFLLAALALIAVIMLLIAVVALVLK